LYTEYHGKTNEDIRRTKREIGRNNEKDKRQRKVLTGGGREPPPLKSVPLKKGGNTPNNWGVTTFSLGYA